MGNRHLGMIAKLSAVVVIFPLLTSCATNMVTYKASQEHYQYWSITKVLSARTSNEDLWLLLELKRERSNFKREAALRIRHAGSVWLKDSEGKVTCPSSADWMRMPAVNPNASDLKQESTFPITGRDLEIQDLELNAPGDLRQPAVKGDPWAVVFVRFKPPAPGSGPKNGWPPALLIVREGDSGRESDRCVLYTFFVGVAHHEGWAFLAPLAIASDVVTLPLQLVAAMLWFIIGD